MKRILLLVLLFSTIVTVAQHKPFQFGFRGGVSLGWLKTDAEGYSNNGAKVGGSWGLVADIFLMEGYSITTGFDIAYVNSSMNKPLGDSMPDIMMVRDIKTRYIQLPIIFTMKTKAIKDKFRLYGQLGFGLGFLLGAKTDDKYTTSEGQEMNDTKNITGELTFTRVSLILGTGVEIPIQGSTVARLGVKYDNCFANILKGDEAIAKNNFFEINLAVLF